MTLVSRIPTSDSVTSSSTSKIDHLILGNLGFFHRHDQYRSIDAVHRSLLLSLFSVRQCVAFNVIVLGSSFIDWQSFDDTRQDHRERSRAGIRRTTTKPVILGIRRIAVDRPRAGTSGSSRTKYHTQHVHLRDRHDDSTFVISLANSHGSFLSLVWSNAASICNLQSSLRFPKKFKEPRSTISQYDEEPKHFSTSSHCPAVGTPRDDQ